MSLHFLVSTLQCFHGLILFVESITKSSVLLISFLTRCSDAYSDTMLGYANSIRTIDGGTHIEGIKASLTRTLNNLGKKSKIIKVRLFDFTINLVML